MRISIRPYFLYSLIVLLVLPVIGSPATAQETAEVQTAAPAEAAPVPYPRSVKNIWKDLRSAVKSKEWDEARALSKKLDTVRVESGYDGFHSYSTELIGFAESTLQKGHQDEAFELIRMARTLSPGSPMIILKTLPVVRATRGSQEVLASLRDLFSHLHRSPDILIEFIDIVTYPLLLALGLTVFLAFGISLSRDLVLIVRRVAARLPMLSRGLFAPIIVTLLLIVPFLGGMYVAMLSWSVIAILIVPRYRFFALLTGALFVVWGTIIPIKENLRVWVEAEDIKLMRQVLAGSFEGNAHQSFERLLIHRPDDTLVPYTYGVLLLQGKQYKKAGEMFDRAEGDRSLLPWIMAQRGNLLMRQRNYKVADQMFDVAEANGLDSPEFFVNRSRVKSQILETIEAREYMSKAAAISPDIVEESSKEEALRSGDELHIKPLYLPFSRLMKSTLLPSLKTTEPYDSRAQQIIPGVTMIQLCIIGGILFSMGIFIRRQESDHQVRLYYPNYTGPAIWRFLVMIVPGAGWMISRRPILGITGILIFALLCVPLLAAPEDASLVYGLLSDLKIPYLTVLAGVAISLYVLSMPGTAEEEE